MHILLDAARLDGLIYQAKELNEQHGCLFIGDSETVLGHVGPWLFNLDRYSYFADWVVEHGAKNSWGVIVKSSASFDELFKHFRKFLIVHKEDGKELYFRFYDPRVLRDFLPTCDSEQLQEFFGPVDAFVLEDEEGNMLEFTLDGSDMVRKELNMDLEQFLLTAYEIDSGNEAVIEAKDDKPKESGDRWDF